MSKWIGHVATGEDVGGIVSVYRYGTRHCTWNEWPTDTSRALLVLYVCRADGRVLLQDQQKLRLE